MGFGFVALANLTIGLLLVVAALLPGAVLASRAAAGLAALPLLDLVLLVRYVFGEDSYRGGGVTRWDAYTRPGGATGPLFFVSAAALVLGAAAIVIAARRRHRRGMRAALAGTGLACLTLVLVTVIAFNVN